MVAEQRFLLEHVVRIEDFSATERFSGATADLIDAILDHAGVLAAEKFAPLNHAGDQTGARWTPGGVIMPPGFCEAYRAFADGGWPAIGAPVEYGGQGLPFSVALAVLEHFDTANLGFSLMLMLPPGAIEALGAHGSAEQKLRWLPDIISGAWGATMNLTEPHAGSDVGALRTQALLQPDGSYRIKGQKIFITFGDHDLTDNIVHLVLARTPEAPEGTRGISLFVVPKYRLDDAGKPGEPNDVRCVSIEHKLGIRASPTCTMAFGDNGDCHGELIGQENGGMRAMFTMMNNARINVGLQGIAIAERASQQAVAYARERIQGSRAGGASREPVAIIEHPDVRRMLLRMRALTQAARALAYFAAGLVDRAHLGDAQAKARLDLLTPLVKVYGTEIGCEVASLGVQIHGGMGFIEETGAAQHYRDARITPIYEGTNGIQAADLVMRKLSPDGVAVLARLIDEIRSELPDEPRLMGLVDDVEEAVAQLPETAADRLAGSSALLAMCAVMTAGWLMARQARVAKRICGDSDFLAMKGAAASFYLAHVVEEARGLKLSATAGAALLYSIPDSAF